MEQAKGSQSSTRPACQYVDLPLFSVVADHLRMCARIDIAREHPHIPELNVLVVGMPNVGKSTLLNSLRAVGIPGRASFF
jgi:ribosome biogenesis GTPase A